MTIKMSTQNIRTQVKHQMLNEISKFKQTYKQDNADSVSEIDGVNSCTNSVSIAVGPQGGRKTFNALNEAISVSHTITETHLIVVFMKKDLDLTVEGVRDLASCPILTLSYDGIESFIRTLVEAKRKYDEFKRIATEHNIPTDQIPDHVEQCDTLMEILHIDGFERNWLNAIIIVDDFGNSNLIRNPDSYLNNCLKLCRAQNIMWYLCVHGMNQLLPSIKQNSAIVYVWRGLSLERLGIVHNQTNKGVTTQEFRDTYQELNDNPDSSIMVIDNMASTVTIQ
jgi:hypothetical protein